MALVARIKYIIKISIENTIHQLRQYNGGFVVVCFFPSEVAFYSAVYLIPVVTYIQKWIQVYLYLFHSTASQLEWEFYPSLFQMC